MKKVIFLLAISINSYFVNAQAVEGQAEYNKTAQSAALVEYVSTVDLVENVLADDLKSRGFGKGKSIKGYKLYQGINFADLSTDKLDLYVKSEKKSKKEKERTIITLLISKGYDNFITGATEPKIMAAALIYLNSLKPKLELGNLDIQIKEQEDVVKKEEKRQNNYIDDLNDLEKKKRNIEDDIVKKKNDIEKQKAEVEKQRQALEALKAQRKN